MESSPFELGNYTVCISSSSWGKRGVLQPTAAKLVTPEKDILLKSGWLQLLLPSLSCWRKQSGFSCIHLPIRSAACILSPNK